MDIQDDALPLLNAIGFERLLHSEPSGLARVRFAPRSEFAHTQGTIVQGGFVSAWLDNAMAYAVSARDAQVRLASLEFKVSFLEPVPVAPVEALARVIRWGGSVVFLEAQLFNAAGQVMATASSTGKLLRPRPAA